ncbi:hypothetical protein AMS68_006871 [Peltaster fructicola]|uniref:Uncharacterized protein n=1 Tax=Peltaster fructicola TaxID=286661 RepID=A0A6H0Y2W6_9PEZI|nr:hypothetical protein AMS68_006871 [Peltaster fructicola]
MSIMTSTTDLARTLPSTCNNDGYKDILNQPQKKYAVYTLTDVDEQQLLEAINCEDSTENSEFAPRHKFSTLREVYDYHLELRKEAYHPLFFIVADQVDPESVLVVHLDCDVDEDDRIGVGRCAVGMADSWGANLDIGNMDWMDLKEEEQNSWGGDDPYEAVESVSQHRFGWYSLVEKAVPLNNRLEPGWLDKQETITQMLGNYYQSSDPWIDIRSEHPLMCRDRPDVHRQLVLAVKTEEVSIVRLDWDGEVTGLSEESARAIMPELEIVKTVPIGEALSEVQQLADE